MTARSSLHRIVPAAAIMGGLLLAAGCASEGPRELSMVKADGNRAMSLEQYDRAADFYSEWAERAPFNAEAQAALGRALLELDRPASARERFEIARDLEPANRAYTNLLAEAAFAAGDFLGLRGILEDEIAREPDAMAYMTAGDFAVRMGATDDAERYYLAAAQADGGMSVTPQIVLADFYGSIGDRDEEFRRLRMATYIDFDNAVVRSRLEGLGHVPGPSLAIRPEELDR
ncbi:MAG: tetratricopeptide repeat protein [Planctomycetota bacterium]